MSIMETIAILQDTRFLVVGGILGAIQIYEMAIIVFCLGLWLQYSDHLPPTSLLLGCKIRVP